MVEAKACVICSVISVGLLLLVILLPLSFSYIDYYHYGLKQRKSTGSVQSDRVYTGGRYLNGPDMTFIKYRADAHLVHLDDVGVFSDGGDGNVGLSFIIDIDFTYKLKKDEIGQLHRDLAKAYESVILSRTNDAIKNSATSVKFSDYFNNRKNLEQQLREAVQTRWDVDPPMHATLGQFHLGRIKIPETVAQKQLTAKIQVEKNKKEEFLQKALLEREMTSVEVNMINLEQDKLLMSARANANFHTAKAVAESEKIRNNAIINGTSTLLTALGIDSEEHTTAYTYIRTLQNRKNLGFRVSYLTDDNVLKTKSS